MELREQECLRCGPWAHSGDWALPGPEWASEDPVSGVPSHSAKDLTSYVWDPPHKPVRDRAGMVGRGLLLDSWSMLISSERAG